MSRQTSPEAYDQALRYAFLLLKYRQRSVCEMRQRLARKSFPADTVEAVVGFLKAKDFLNDEQFARSWTESRSAKSFGPRRVRRELQLKGIAEELVDECLGDISEPSVQISVVRRLAQERLRKDTAAGPRVSERRTAAYLIRRGFSADLVWDVIAELGRKAA